MTLAGGIRIGELARRVGVTTDLLRAWERRYQLFEPDRSPGGYRLYSAEDEGRARAVCTLRAAGLSTAEAIGQVLGSSNGAEARAATAQDALRRLRASVQVFDEAATVETLTDAHLRLGPVDSVRMVVLPAMEEIGDAWAMGQLSVAHEHFATDIVRRHLRGIARGYAGPQAPKALVACPPGERHDLAALAFAVLLAHRGWAVRFLGADTPIPAIFVACQALNPRWTVLAASRASVFEAEMASITHLAQRFPVALGGRGATREVGRRVGARLLPGQVSEAVDDIAADDAGRS